MQQGLDSLDWFGDTECANNQYFLRKQAKPDKPKGESGFSFYISNFLLTLFLVAWVQPRRAINSWTLTMEPCLMPSATAI